MLNNFSADADILGQISRLTQTDATQLQNIFNIMKQVITLVNLQSTQAHGAAPTGAGQQQEAG